MPDPQLDPAQHRAETARRNGALSRGPVSAEGKARSALNATRHGLCARSMPPDADVHELAGLRAALLARWQPMDAAEAHLVEELVFAAWRQMRLRAVEDGVLAHAAAGEAPSPALPSLATVIRYRGRIDRDADRAGAALPELRRRRGQIADPMRLRWLAWRIEQAQALAAACPAPGIGTDEPEDLATAAADSEECTNELPLGTSEPKAPAATDRTAPVQNEPAPPPNGTNELSPGTDEPGQPPTAAPRALNRHQRRRLAALRRRAA